MEELRRYLGFVFIFVLVIAFTVGCAGGKGLSPVSDPQSNTIAAPRCSIILSASSIQLSNSVSARIVVEGSATLAFINREFIDLSAGVGEKIYKPTAVGNYPLEGIVQGPGGEGVCYASFAVAPQPVPTCDLIVPSQAQVGVKFTVVMTVTGQIDTAQINNTNVTPNNSVATFEITPTETGTNVIASGKVTGTGGVNTCQKTYTVIASTMTPPAPTCTIAKSSMLTNLGQSIDFTLFASGTLSAGYPKINNVSVPSGVPFAVAPTTDFFGNPQYVANGVVVGPGGAGTCEVTFLPPRCTLAASNATFPSATLTLTLYNTISAAFIDGIAQMLPAPPINTVAYVKTVPASGTYSAQGSVFNPAGDRTLCDLPSYTVVPAILKSVATNVQEDWMPIATSGVSREWGSDGNTTPAPRVTGLTPGNTLKIKNMSGIGINRVDSGDIEKFYNCNEPGTDGSGLAFQFRDASGNVLGRTSANRNGLLRYKDAATAAMLQSGIILPAGAVSLWGVYIDSDYHDNPSIRLPDSGWTKGCNFTVEEISK